MRRGFTLIELLIVLAVIAALMAVATPVGVNAVAEAKHNQVAQNLRNIEIAIQNYAFVEKPDDNTLRNLTVEELKNKKYLSSAPSGYYLEIS